MRTESCKGMEVPRPVFFIQPLPFLCILYKVTCTDPSVQLLAVQLTVYNWYCTVDSIQQLFQALYSWQYAVYCIMYTIQQLFQALYTWWCTTDITQSIDYSVLHTARLCVEFTVSSIHSFTMQNLHILCIVTMKYIILIITRRWVKCRYIWPVISR